MVSVRPINLNVSCKLPSGPHLPRRIRNMHPCNYYNLKSKDIDVHFLFKQRNYIVNWMIMCDVDWWLSGRVSALHSVVAGSIFSGGDHSIYCWWDLIRLKQLSSVSVCHAQMFTGFSSHGNSIHNIIPLLKKENIDLYPCPWGHNNYMDAYFRSSWEDMALEVTVSSVKSTDITCKTHSG